MFLILPNFGKTKTKTNINTNSNPNPNPDPNRYRRCCPDPNVRIQKFTKFTTFRRHLKSHFFHSALPTA